MDKKWIIYIIVTIIVGLAFGIGFGIYSSNNSDTENMDLLSEKELAESEENNLIEQNNINTLETSAVNNVISPNAIVIKKTYYEACDHLIRETEDIPEELVNKTEETARNFFSDWTIEEYSPTQIILYKSEAGNCGQHYFIQEHNGVIGIYTIDENEEKTLKEDTEIVTQYLPDEDLETLKEGVEIIGNTNLVEFLEDYE